MTVLTTFYATVSKALGRGTTLDADIPTAAHNACRELETTYSWDYMKREYQLTVTPGIPPVIDFIPDEMKKLDYIRFVYFRNGTEEYTYLQLQQSTPQDLQNRIDSNPQWLEEYFGTPSRIDFGWHEYTVWPVSTADPPPAILTAYYNLMKAATILAMGADVRDDKLMAHWHNGDYNPFSYTKCLNAAMLTEQEAEQAQQNYIMKPYMPV